MKLVILTGQCFGLNPVLGVCEIDTSKLRFTIYSGRFLYTFLSIMGQMWLVGLCVMKLGKISNPSLSSNTSLVFYGTNCLTTMVFVRIAMKWPKMSEHIARLEASDPNVDSGLVRRCNISCIVVLSLAFVEHILSDMSGLAVAIDCQPDTNIYEAFILESFPWVWTFVEYNHFTGFLAQFFNLQCTFNWNFADAFVICMSWYLTARLKQVNDRIVAVRGKYVTATFWRTMREDYSKATSLVRRVDSVISGIIFISFANNLFFICLQFLHILE
ncbi:hypothetical protein O0L34_g8281 [Tuta absoluta]|nr:hypothetical protein O0L34_g8281 [Tuta absoluta]